MSCRVCGAANHAWCDSITGVQVPPVADDVNLPAHYRTGKIEVIEIIEDQKLGYRLGNVIKYVCRHAHKGTPLKDLKKARWYLDREIAALEMEAAP